ncbi:MAG: hypothetical protein K0Q76_3300 [Panacagrimonas sp.]|nr:hypothetical protein [Panacagrimonas sp.]MCC2658192.1 hypothetical protein [Panacagrimonas sp.]
MKRASCSRLALSALSLGLLASSAATWALPDLARGKAALERGDLAAAESDLKPLAEQGYLEAQVALARTYAAQNTRASAVQAVEWYRLAAKQDPALRLPLVRTMMRAGRADPAEVDKLLKEIVREDSSALPLQLRLYREFPQLVSLDAAAGLAQKVAQSRLPEERAEAIAWYRAHRDEQVAEKALVSLCERDRKLVQECYADLVMHYRSTEDKAALEKIGAEVVARYKEGQVTPENLERVARAMSSEDDVGEPNVEGGYKLLTLIKEPSASVLARKARMLVLKPSLDPSADAVELLRAAYKAGSLEAALYLGRLYLDESNPHADAIEAERLLREAAPTLSGAHVWLGRLYERGYQGLPDPSRALKHYLVAARAGHPNADMALARMYSRNRGIRVDPVKAYAFAKLAEHYGNPGAPDLLNRLQPVMSQQQVANAQALAEAEFDARHAAAALPRAVATDDALATASSQTTKK